MPISEKLLTQFSQAASRAGAKVVRCVSTTAAVAYLVRHAGGTIVMPDFPDAHRLNLLKRLQEQGAKVICDDLCQTTATATASITGANFGLADTGTVVLEASSPEVRLASTLPERHFLLLHPGKILPDHMAAVPLLRRFHSRHSPAFIAFITGPDRAAATKQDPTIKTHGPRELHILLLETLSDNFLQP